MHTLLPHAALPPVGAGSEPIVWAYADAGGSISEAGGWRYHSLTSNDTINFTVAGVVEYLAVGGGGGGGLGGGGGGGEVLPANGVPGTLDAVVGAYAATIGAGGLGAVGANGGLTGPFSEAVAGGSTILRDPGNNILFEARGGGRGGSWTSADVTASSGGNGGTGGGGSVTGSSIPGTARPGGTALGEAGDGGAGTTKAEVIVAAGGGGGGAGGNGAAGTGPGTSLTTGGAGGPGVASDIGGTLVYYGAGGGGSGYGGNNTYKGPPGLGGSGWGGTYATNGQQFSAAANGANGVGDGGGGSYGGPWSSSAPVCGRGGSGRLIIRYRIS